VRSTGGFSRATRNPSSLLSSPFKKGSQKNLLFQKKMKNILSILFAILLLSGFANAFDTSQCEERIFTVTAYYSPEVDQIFYYKPNFQEEVILNGE
jgi:hypothetical protein